MLETYIFVVIMLHGGSYILALGDITQLNNVTWFLETFSIESQIWKNLTQILNVQKSVKEKITKAVAVLPLSTLQEKRWFVCLFPAVTPLTHKHDGYYVKRQI